MCAESKIDTAEFFPHDCPVLRLSSTDAARQIVEYLTEAVINLDPESPFSIGEKQFQAIKILHIIIATYLLTIAHITAPAPRVPLPGAITVSSPRVISPGPTTVPSLRVTIIVPQKPTVVDTRQYHHIQHPSTVYTAYRYTLASHILAAHEAYSHFEANSGINPITGMSQ